MNEIEIKKCAACGKSKPLSEFGKRKNTKDGLSPYCKECVNETQREWRKNKRMELLSC